MNRLLDIGFERAGYWRLQDDTLKCELLKFGSQINVLYAFVCDGEVKYVGKTIRSLSVRMTGYRNPGSTQSTNIRNHLQIKKLLEANVAVEIFILPDNGLLHFGQFHLNLAAALEDDIIRVIDPEWNGGKPSSQPDNSVSTPLLADSTSSAEEPDSTTTKFSFAQQPTYYRTGFFNIGVGWGELFGADGETIELFLGGNTQPSLGTINRRANTNGTPRIMGGTSLRKWFGHNAKIMGTIAVELYSPNSIRLRAPQD